MQIILSEPRTIHVIDFFEVAIQRDAYSPSRTRSSR